MGEAENQGLTRRQMLRRGVVTGGAALAWATPVVTTIGLDRALASVPSPVCDISYIAINFTCGSGLTYYSKKDAGGWDSGAGQVASQCPGISTANGTDDPTQYGIDVDLNTGAIINTGSCEITMVGVFAANQCTVYQGNPGNVCTASA